MTILLKLVMLLTIFDEFTFKEALNVEDLILYSVSVFFIIYMFFLLVIRLIFTNT